MIPSVRHKFEALSKFPKGFGHRGRSILVNGILYFRLFGHLGMTSSKYQNVKITWIHLSHGDCDWGRSILVNGILCFRLFGHLDMTSSKYQNVIINSVSGSNLRGSLGIMYHMVIDDSKRSARVWSIIEVPRRFWPPRVHRNSHITSVSSSNLRRPLGIMYHMVIHDSKRWAQVWRLIEGFPRVLSHPGRHTGPRLPKTHFFGKRSAEISRIGDVARKQIFFK